MNNSQEANQPNNHPHPSDTASKMNPISEQSKQDFFCFLKDEENSLKPLPFFSKNGLGHDIIRVTNAEPDICLEGFYALYNTLWPQLEKLNEYKKLGMEEHRRITSLQDAWTNFIGGSILKGVLCSPEKLIGPKKPKDIKQALSENKGEDKIFQNLDQVINSISHLKQKILDYPGPLLYKEEIITSLDLVQQFYQRYRNQVKTLGQGLVGAASVLEYETSMNALVDLLEPKAVMMSDIFTNHWAYRIPRNTAQKLLSLDENRRPLENYSSEAATHRVTALPEKNEAPEPLVYFKANGGTPIQPEKEFMLSSLYRQLQIPVPETALVILTDVFEGSQDYFYAVQASEAVSGTSAFEACQNKEKLLEQEAYVSQVIGTLLTNPSDGSFKNFKYNPIYKTLISIDNDLIFKPELSQDLVNVKSVLYLLPQMDIPIPKSIKTFFTTLDPHLTILSWLKVLSQKNREYQLLFTRLAFQNTRCIYQNLLPQSETPSLEICLTEKVLVDADLHHNDIFSPQILVSKHLLSNISEKLQIIVKTLLQNSSMSSQILFEKVSCVLGKYYQKLRLKFPEPEKALEALWGEKKDGVDYSEMKSLLSSEELKDSLLNNRKNFTENLLPEVFFKEYKKKLDSERTSPLDKFIQRHNIRKRMGLLNFNQALEELRLLIQEELIESQCPRDIVDFCYSLSRMPEANSHHTKEITSLLFNLPSTELKWLLVLEEYFKRAEYDVPKDLKSSSISITGAFLKQRTFFLTKSQRLNLFDNQGNLKKNTSLTGRSCVTCFPEKSPEFYLKQYPELPGYEFANIAFMRMLGVTHLPHQELIIVDSKYPVLLTQAINGAPVFRIWDDPEAFDNLDPFHTSLLIISAMLLNPEDGKEDNYLLSPDGRYLIPIDNDHCFLPSTFQKGKFLNLVVNTALQTKTLLFCLDEMNKSVPLEVRQHILAINFDSLLTSWLQELIKVDDRYHHLVDEKQRDAFLYHGTVFRIPFHEQFIHSLYWKVKKIQDLLRSPSEQTPFSLLKAVEPFAARCYEESFQHEDTLQGRFKAATSKLYKKTHNGSRMSVLNTQIMMDIIKIPVKDFLDDLGYHEIWPFETFETLKSLIQDRNKNRKLEQDFLCELDDSSQESIWTTLFGNPLLQTALNSFFTNPKEGLFLKGSSAITSNYLANLFADQGTKIKFLSLPNSPLLDSKTIKTLVEGCPNLEYLNVNGCVKLEEIITQKGDWSLLARLEAKECLNLKKVTSSSPVKILRIGTDQKIQILIEKHTLEIFTIITKTNQFDFSLEKGENFEVSSPPKKDFSVDILLQNALINQGFFERYFKSPKITIGMHSVFSPEDLGIFVTSLDLRTLEINHEMLKKLVQTYKLTNLKSLQFPPFPRVVFEDLIQGEWPKLAHISLNLNSPYLTDEECAILSQGNWPHLGILNLGDSKVTKKGLLNLVLNSNWYNLEEIISCQKSNSSIRGQKNGHLLEELNLNSCQITQREMEAIVNKSKWPNLKLLNLSDNEIDDEGFAILSHGNWPQLKTLDLSHTKVTNKGLLNFYSNVNWPKLQRVVLPSCVDAHLASSLLQKKFSQVERLELDNVKMTSAEIDLIVNYYQFNSLKSLNLSNNEISDEGVLFFAEANFPLLEEFHLKNTKITSQGIEKIGNQSNWKKLKYLNLSKNEILDGGLSLLALREWPLLEELYINNTGITPVGIEILVNKMKFASLKKLDISENPIHDEGLSKLASGQWPLFQHLVYYDTKVTLKGNLTLLEKLQWPDFQYLEHSLTESFYNYNEDSGQWSLSDVILATFPVYHETESQLVAVLNTTWLGSKFIHLSIRHNSFHQKVMILPRDKLDQVEFIKLSLPTFPLLQSIVLPSNLKILDLSNNLLSDEKKLESLFWTKCALLEDLNLENTNITTKGMKFLINKSDWPFLKKLCLSDNKIFGEGLELLLSKKWPLLESLELRNVGLTAVGIKSMRALSEWPNLKILNVSDNEISDKGLKILSSGKWPLLEKLKLIKTDITIKGIKRMIKRSQWPNLKEIDLTDSPSAFESLVIQQRISANWPGVQLTLYE